MASNFSNSFTGKDIMSPIQGSGELQRSQERLSDLLLTAEKTKTDIFQKNQAEFLKNSNVDPVFVLSDSARQAQATMLDGFNQKWGKTMKERGGNLTLDDKMQMAREKDVILMQQQKWQADLTKAMADRDAVSKDVQGNIDKDDFQSRWNNFTKTGNYDSSPLLPSAINPDEYFNKATNKVNGTPGNVTMTKNINGVPYKENYQASGTEQEGRERVKNTLLSNDRVALGYIKKFKELRDSDPETYQRYLDTNKDGIVSPSEEKAVNSASNPILQWAQDSYWHKALDMKLSQPTKVNTGTGSNLNISLFGKQVKFAPGEQRQGSITYADKTYDNPVEFDGSFKLTNVPTSGGGVLKGQYTKPISSKGNIEGYLKNYDPDRDVLILAATGTDPNIDNGSLVEIPAKNLNQVEVNKIPVTIDGKQTTLGTLRGQQKTTASVPIKKKFNAVTGKFE